MIDSVQSVSNSNPSNSNPVKVSTPANLGKLFYSLGDQEGVDMEILTFLLKGPKSVTEITHHVKRTDSATSQRLSKLRLLGLVTQTAQGRERIYRVIPGLKENLIESIEKVLR